MRLNLLILAITILLGAGLTIWLDGQNNAAPDNAQPSDINAADSAAMIDLPVFTFTDLSGRARSSSDFKGKTVLLNFWATWCAPCVVEFPKLVKLAQDNPDILVVALSSDINDAAIHAFLKKYPAKAKNIIVARDDKRHITSDIFNTYKLPETQIVSPSGKMVRKIVGDTDWNGGEIKNYLSSLR